MIILKRLCGLRLKTKWMNKKSKFVQILIESSLIVSDRAVNLDKNS